MIKYFGELAIGVIFLFNDIKMKKINDYQGESLRTKRRVEFSWNLRVKVCEEQNKN
jgi:hypothetical protein